MTTEQLKPCPFCGTAPNQGERQGIWCNNDACAIVGLVFSGGTNHWNRRTPVEQLSARTAEPYGYVLKTGHGTAFRETLAGVEPDFIKHWIRLYTDPPVIQTEQDSNKDALVWESITPCYTRFISEARYQKFSPGVRAWYRPVCEKCGAIDSNKDAEPVAMLFPDDDSPFGYSMMAKDSHPDIAELCGGFHVFANPVVIQKEWK